MAVSSEEGICICVFVPLPLEESNVELSWIFTELGRIQCFVLFLWKKFVMN